MIESARLVLRPPQHSDLPFILAEINTPGMMRYLGGKVRDADEVATGLTADIAAFAAGTWRRWTVFRRDDDCPIGRVGLFVVQTEAAPAVLLGQHEIGWMLAQDHQGQGYATEAAQAVLGYGFAQLAFPSIHAQTSDSNTESTRMMARLGFSRAQELDYVDPAYPAADNPTTVYRLAPEAWNARA
ncbi:GNAT family N-acetyltransferase [Novosphingobium aquiterrae]|uniref:GNAT family N-acetyltransferase n=1 Tax=Novosphingobium aquiterrae TaxID=624388 RepID=A0ABV6PL92_9SPHN